MFKTGENELTLPHLYSCTEQLLLLRSMLLREDGDVLQLGEGIPRAWLSTGRHVDVDSAPTDFGTVSYRIEAARDGVDRVHILPPSRHMPKEIRLHLRLPDGEAIESIQGTSRAGAAYSGNVITFHNLQQPIDIEVHFRKTA